MNMMQLRLTDTENNALLTISQSTGKTMNELFHEAIQALIRQFPQTDRRVLLQQARGMWKDRNDLPALDELRQEWERSTIEK